VARILPDTFAGVREAADGKWSDAPFATQTIDKVTTVALPINKPEGQDTLRAFGCFLELLETTGFKCVQCTGDKAYQWNAFAAIKDSILGAYLCLKREQLTLVDSIPAAYKAGWDFALWYAFSSGSKVQNENEFTKLKRVTSLSLTVKGGNQWQAGGQLSELTRLDTIIRLAAHARATSLAEPRSFLKAKGYFVDRCVGKKPVRGLYTDVEFVEAQKIWTHRASAVEQAYTSLPVDWTEIADTVGGLKPYLDRIQKAGSRQGKDIEDCVTQRLKSLTFIPAKGRDKSPRIVSGASLKDKIMNANLTGLRQIANLMWSPLLKVDRNTFVDAALRGAYNTIVSGVIIPEAIKKLTDAHAHSPALLSSLLSFEGEYATTISLYVELYPTNREQESWGAFFGNAPA
jgi:hypothetical protein